MGPSLDEGAKGPFPRWYSSRMQANLESRLGCTTTDDYSDNDNVVDDDAADYCELAAFLMWCAPIIAAVTGFVFAFLMHLLAVAAFQALHHDKEVIPQHKLCPLRSTPNQSHSHTYLV